ncbi:MAG: DUF2779 domain-containing protein, partial [Nitrospirae bacterium]|nr:DUF2779 domain-containing protein [Nitrospirota bacterium]
MNSYLSKSLYMNGLKCHKALYLQKYHAALKNPITEDQQMLFNNAEEVNEAARLLFPGGVLMNNNGNLSIPYQINDTARKIKRGTPAIFEGSFSFNDVFTRVDILALRNGLFHLYEVKSTTEVKDQHKDDVALQYYVLTGAEIKVESASVVFINNQYVRNGKIEPGDLFLIQDITDIVKGKQGYVVSEINKMKQVLMGQMPATDIGEYCLIPFECDFKGYCWQRLPKPSVLDLKGRCYSGVNKFDMYRNGIVHFEEINLQTLSEGQRIQVTVELNHENVLNHGAISQFLGTLHYPLVYLDFETFMHPIPFYSGCRPYQQTPFQYSIHVIPNEGAESVHYEFLAESGS